MTIESTENDWRLGELVSPKWNYELIKKDGQKSYAYYAVSGYICVREATDEQCGILLKVLGKISKKYIMFVNGEPFCKAKGKTFSRANATTAFHSRRWTP